MDFIDLGKRFVVTGPKSTFTEHMNSVVYNPELVSVDNLTISNTDLKTIDVLPEVEEININNNNELTTIRKIPESVQRFKCTNNKELTSIQEFGEIEYSELKYFEATNNNLKHFPELPPGIEELYLSGNPFTKNMRQIRKMVEYIFEHNCESDIEDIIDLKTYHSMKLATKKGTIRVGNKELPNELYKELIKYSLAGKKTRKKRKSKTQKRKPKKKPKKKPRKKSN